MTTPRYPLAPLATALGVELGRPGRHNDEDPVILHGRALLAARLERSITTIATYLRTGLSDEQADQLATKAGIHPARIWPNWWDHVHEGDCDPDRPCICGLDQHPPDRFTATMEAPWPTDESPTTNEQPSSPSSEKPRTSARPPDALAAPRAA